MSDEHDVWRSRRDEAVFAPYGIASLAATNWLDVIPRPVEGAPGLWRTDGTAAIGDVEGAAIRLAPGEERDLGELRVRGFARDGAVAVRVLDPAAAARRGIGGIERFPYDPAMRVRGRFVPTGAGLIGTVAVDGHRSTAAYDGVVEAEVAGTRVSLTVEVDDDGSLFASLSDGTSGTESHRFRFLSLPAPTFDGTLEVDFNRLYLPPCAFSDHYVCVLPPPGNSWDVPLRAGEALVV